MGRTNASARAAGTRFERTIADYLATKLEDDRIERAPRWGAKDCGDIVGVRTHMQRIAIECKDTTRPTLAGWVAEAEIERGNYDALAGIVIHKRKGISNPGQQYVTMTLDELLALITGQRQDQP